MALPADCSDWVETPRQELELPSGQNHSDLDHWKHLNSDYSNSSLQDCPRHLGQDYSSPRFEGPKPEVVPPAAQGYFGLDLLKNRYQNY